MMITMLNGSTQIIESTDGPVQICEEDNEGVVAWSWFFRGIPPEGVKTGSKRNIFEIYGPTAGTYQIGLTKNYGGATEETKEMELIVTEDVVHSPPHYTVGKIECIEFIEDQEMGFHYGNALKYLVRAKHKGNEKEDLKKAIWYIERVIKGL